jgi:hypothetical protein
MYETEAMRTDLQDDDKGFYVLKGFYSEREVDDYRGECERFLRVGKVIYDRINTDSMTDYVHPRSHDDAARTYRIYQFLHNHRDDAIGRFLGKALSLRDEIEAPWLADEAYRTERAALQNYVIVTYYLRQKGMLPRHQDYTGPAPLPLVQFWVLLCHPGVDYQGGNLVLYTRSGRSHRVEADLGLKKGDALVFDKSLFHEVEVMGDAGDGSIGRWTVLIGARAKRDPFWRMCYKRMYYDGTWYPGLSKAKQRLKRAMRWRAAVPG